MREAACSKGAQFAEFRDVRTSALPILERKIVCQVHVLSLIIYCVPGQYSLKAEALFENYLSSKMALAVPNKKNMCVKGISFHYFQ